MGRSINSTGAGRWGFAVVLLLVASLAFLQALNSEKDLLSCLAAYALIALALILAFVTLKGRVAAALPILATAGFFGYVILRALLSPAPYTARADLSCSLAALLVYSLSSFYLSSSAQRIASICALLAFAVVHVLVSLIQAGLGENLIVVSSLEVVGHSSRGTGLFVNPDHLAGLLEVLGILGLSLACWSRWPSWAKVVIAYLAGVSYFGLILTGSRGGYWGSLFSLFVFALLSLITLRAGGTTVLVKIGGSSLFLAALVMVALWLFFQHSSSFRGAVENILTIDAGRLGLWRAALAQWKLQPLLGTGSGTYLFYGRQFRAEQNQLDPIDVHNDYLQLVAEYGLIGAAGFLFFFFVHLRHAWINFLWLGPARVGAGSVLSSDRLALTIGALGAVAAYVVHSAVDFNLHIPANALLLAFVFGLLANPGIVQANNQPLVRYGRLLSLSIALVLLIQCLRLIPGEYYAEQALIALRDEDPATAISRARTALTYERQNPNIFFRLGRAQAALANRNESPPARALLLEQALPAFEEANRLVPLDGTYPLERAIIYDRLGRFVEAEKMYELARARDPHSDTVEQMYRTHLQAWQNQKPLGSN